MKIMKIMMVHKCWNNIQFNDIIERSVAFSARPSASYEREERWPRLEPFNTTLTFI